MMALSEASKVVLKQWILLGVIAGMTMASWAEGTAVQWSDLLGLDPKSGKMDASVRNLDGRIVSLAGFAIPLEMGAKPNTVRELILFPDEMYCRHVPPPPANQLLEVVMEDAFSMDLLWGPIRLTGKLSVVEITGRNYKAGYKLEGTKVKQAYDYEGTGAIAPHQEYP